MAIRIFVTATNTDVGKTYTTLGLMEEAARQGLRPAALKPIETGVKEGVPADGSALLTAMQRLNPAASALGLEDVVPIRFELPAAPYVAKGEAPLTLEPVYTAIEKIEPLCDILFIEGAGGLLVPIEKGLYMIDLPARIGAHTLLIAPSSLGSINDSLLSMEALKARSIPFDFLINLYKDAQRFATVTRPFYEKEEIAFALLPEALPETVKKLSLLPSDTFQRP
ncbi:dethiobiotin synthase [Hydrogenimonas sp.]